MATGVYRLTLLLMVVAVAGAMAVSARPQGADNSVSGTVRLDRKGLPDSQLEVTLYSVTGAGRLEGFTDSSGNFRFERVRAGSYRVTVRAPYGSPYDDGTADVAVYASPGNTNYTVNVTLPLKRELRPKKGSSGGTVSVEELGEKIPKAAKDMYKQGMLYANDGKLERAISSFERAVEMAPTYVAALNELGVYRIRLGRSREALEPLAKAVELSPKAFEPRLNLSLAHLLEGRYDNASEQIDAALALDPVSTRALCIGGEIAFRLHRFDDSIARYQRAFSIGDEMKGYAAFALGEVFEAKGQRPQALEAYQAVLKIEPRSERATRARARIKALGGR